MELGGCSDKISREHLVSAALWDGPTIDVIGFPWCKTEPKTVGVASVTAKILCRTHNTALSDVDSAGASAFDVLKRSARLAERRHKERPRKWKVARFEIDGRRLERWFLKTLINVAVSNATPGRWNYSGTALDCTPPKLFVDAAFGLGALQKPLGLYGLGSLGEDIVPSNSVELRTLLIKEDSLAAAVFTFLGIRFLLNLSEGDMPRSAYLPAGREWVDSSLVYHIERLNNKIGKKLSHYVHFLYNTM